MKTKKLQLIEKKMDWLRSLKEGEELSGQLASPKECYTLSVLIARLNSIQSEEKGYKIRAHYYASRSQVTIYTVPL